MRRVPLILALGLIAAGCADDSDGEAAETSLAMTTTEQPATSVADLTTTTMATNFTETRDIVYRTTSSAEFSMDVYEPVGTGPWPVVIAFHGASSDLKDESFTTVVAEEAAAQGMLVFVPTWIDFSAFPPTIGTYEEWIRTANCAVAFAQQNAATYGGEAETTVLHGFSAGIGPSLFAVLQPADDPISGCATEAPPAPIAGVVLGDGEYFLHTQTFDGAFATDLEAMQAEVAALIDPSHWPEDLDAEFFLWSAGDGTNARPIGDLSDESGWFAQRDPDGSIRADLDRLGQLEDGIVTYIDASQLLALRLSEAGFEVTLDEYPGGHTTHDKVPELVGYLQAAAAN